MLNLTLFRDVHVMQQAVKAPNCNRTDKNMQPDPGSNRGPSAYRANALPTELPDCLHIIHPVPVHTQVTLSTVFNRLLILNFFGLTWPEITPLSFELIPDLQHKCTLLIIPSELSGLFKNVAYQPPLLRGECWHAVLEES